MTASTLYKRADKGVLIMLSAALLLFTGLYYSNFGYLLHEWKKEDFNYCILIPFIVLYLIWDRRKEVASVPSRPSWAGLSAVISGLIFFWLGELGGEYYTLFLSSWLLLVGLCWSVMGWQKLKVIWFPLVFSLAMFPFPNFINTKLLLMLKLISSEIGVRLMQLMGMSAFREGNIIDIGVTQLQVVDACSGLRYVFPLVILALLLAYSSRLRLYKGALLVVSAVPLSVVMNGLRIAGTGLLYLYYSPAAAEGFFHGFSGFLIFMVSLVFLWLEMLFLTRILPGTRKKAEVPEEKVILRRDYDSPGGPKSKGHGLFYPPQLAAAVVLMGVTLAAAQIIDFREHVPSRLPFSDFPMKIGKWTGISRQMDQKFVDSLDLSDYVMGDYSDPDGRLVNFYVAYYQSQRKGESIHSPATCLPGSGWIFKHDQVKKIPFPGYPGGFLPVHYVSMQKGAYRQIAYYWFPQRGRNLTSAYQLKIYNFWDALTKHRTDGALVRVITPVYQGEDVQDARERLNEFVRTVVPVLRKFIPGKDAGKP